MMTAVAITACVLAFIPAALFLRNLALYRPLPEPDGERRQCSVLIPARNEEENIADALDSLLQSGGIDFEVIVLDDGSTDRTAAIVREFAERDTRIRLETARPLPPGWCGKNRACQQLASLAHHPLLIFMDADVRISRTDSLARLAYFIAATDASLVSGVPREEAHTFMERLVIPLIHFVLLGFLPIGQMRRTTDPRFAAACGQILAVRREAYERTGGHGAIANRIHDGVALTRNFRAHGFRTDLFDGTDSFWCRMYRDASAVWHGFAKNAHEGLATAQLILPSTLLLVGGQVLPLILAVVAPSPLAFLALAAVFLPRLLAAWRFRQSVSDVFLHPLGICILISIQWFAYFSSLRRRPVTWKGRAYNSANAV